MKLSLLFSQSDIVLSAIPFEKINAGGKAMLASLLDEEIENESCCLL
jgi:hypothetical protein